MTRRLLAFFAAELVMLIGCSDSPSRYHNHGTPGDGHFTPKPQIFAIDLEADPSAKKSKPKPKPTGNTDTDITPDGVGHPEYDPQTGGFPKESNIRLEHNPPSLAFPRSNPRPRNGECPVCGTMAKLLTTRGLGVVG